MPSEPRELVLDASAAAKLFRTQEDHAAAFTSWLSEQAAQGTPLLVPPVFAFEMRNIAVRSVRERVLADLAAARQAADDSRRMTRETAVNAATEIEAALAHGLSTYDASYLLLASAKRPLVTYDEKLAKAVRAKAGPKAVLTPT